MGSFFPNATWNVTYPLYSLFWSEKVQTVERSSCLYKQRKRTLFSVCKESDWFFVKSKVRYLGYFVLFKMWMMFSPWAKTGPMWLLKKSEPRPWGTGTWVGVIMNGESQWIVWKRMIFSLTTWPWVRWKMDLKEGNTFLGNINLFLSLFMRKMLSVL